jgi:hypothetical protein
MQPLTARIQPILVSARSEEAVVHWEAARKGRSINIIDGLTHAVLPNQLSNASPKTAQCRLPLEVDVNRVSHIWLRVVTRFQPTRNRENMNFFHSMWVK